MKHGGDRTEGRYRHLFQHGFVRRQDTRQHEPGGGARAQRLPGLPAGP